MQKRLFVSDIDTEIDADIINEGRGVVDITDNHSEITEFAEVKVKQYRGCDKNYKKNVLEEIEKEKAKHE